MGLSFRPAVEADLWALMALYQRFGSTFTEDPLFLDYYKLRNAVLSNDSVWLLTEEGTTILSVVSLLLDREQGVAKMSRMMINPDDSRSQEHLQRSIRNAIEYLRAQEPSIDLVYSTTLTLPLHLQEVTLKEGFQITGVFPNALGVDQSKLNGLTVYVMDGVLANKRQKDIEIHPKLHPFFQLVKSAFALEDARVAEDLGSQVAQDYEPMPLLEMVRAPLLVDRKFERLKAHQSMAINFYPFYKPNALICDPDQQIEIYVKIVDNLRFAAIIGEHTEVAIDPVSLYSAVIQLLKQQGISYIEIINDAADVFGTECILEAGFTPCAYIPAFKRQGESRRDYAVFGKSFEYLCKPDPRIARGYLDFFRQYARLERRHYFAAFR